MRLSLMSRIILCVCQLVDSSNFSMTGQARGLLIRAELR